MSRKAKTTLFTLGLLTILVICFLLAYRKKSLDREKEAANAKTEVTEIAGEVNTDILDDSISDTDKDSFDQKEEISNDITNEIDSSKEEIVTPIEEVGGEISLLFTGDVELSEGVQEAYSSQGIEGVISSGVRELMTSANVTFINNEFCFSTRGEQAADKQYTFRVNPSYVSALTDMGVDIASLANNHSLDYGHDALTDTFSTLENAGIKYVGAGADFDRASELQIFEIGGKKIGFLAASRVYPVVDWNVLNTQPGMFGTYDSELLNLAIENSREQVDFLVVYVHWGIEKASNPEEYQRNLGHEYIDAGADLVVGAHPHVLQGVEYYNGKPIFYSLGNFIFNSSIPRTAVLSVKLEKDMNPTYTLIPASASNYLTQISEGEDASNTLKYVKSISYHTNIDTDTGVVSER